MKRLRGIICAFVIALSLPTITVSANSLDEVINDNQQNEQQEQQAPVQTPVQDTNQTNNGTSGSSGTNVQQISGLLDNAKVDLNDASPAADSINRGIGKIGSTIVKILSYGITALMVVRVLLDLCYITLPFTRSILANGYGGQAMGGQPGMGQPGMGGGMGMGMGGMGMNRGMGMGMGGGYGMNRGMGMGGMGMGQQGMSQPGATPAMGRVQWVSTAALNACASEQAPGPDGRPQSPLKIYAKDMTVMLVATPIMLVLAVSGALVNLGIMLGELLVNAIGGIGNMF